MTLQVVSQNLVVPGIHSTEIIPVQVKDANTNHILWQGTTKELEYTAKNLPSLVVVEIFRDYTIAKDHLKYKNEPKHKWPYIISVC